MLDYIRNLLKSSEEKQQELLTAYLDDELSPGARRRFEEALAKDPALQAEVDKQHQIKLSLRNLPRLRSPRNFTLDPALYGRPARQPAFQFYPLLRGATAVAAVLLVVLLTVDLFTEEGRLGDAAPSPASALIASETDLATAAEPEAAVGLAAEEVTADEEAEEMMAEAEAPEEEVSPEPLEETEAAAAEDAAPEGAEALEVPPAGEIELLPTITAEAPLEAYPGPNELTARSGISETITAQAAAPAITFTTPVATGAESVSQGPLAAPVAPSPDEGLPALRVAEILAGAAFLLLFATVMLIRRQR